MVLPTDVSQPAVCCWTKFCFSFIFMPATIILQSLVLTKRNKYAKIYS